MKIVLFSILSISVNSVLSYNCSNGATPGDECHLAYRPNGYVCASDLVHSRCENFNGSYRCCALSPEEDCSDRSKYCRYMTTFCTSEAHREMMIRQCASTCKLCGEQNRRNMEKKLENIEEISNLTTSFETTQTTESTTTTTVNLDILTSAGGNCTRAGKGRKCVFPREKMLTTPLPLGAENQTIFIANLTIVEQKTNGTGSIDITFAGRNTTRRSTPSSSPVSPPSNENLKNFLSTKRTTSQQTEAVRITTPSKPTTNSSLEARKIKLQELMSTKDLVLPRITTGEPETFTVSIAKTLIRGTCFDEYMYCREFASLCNHPTYGDVMALHCTMTCKRCDEVEREEEGKDDCSDVSPKCSEYKDVCHDERYLQLTRDYCAKTCGHCVAKCRDRHQNCEQFAKDGFCADEMYTNEERQHLCGATCGLCKKNKSVLYSPF